MVRAWNVCDLGRLVTHVVVPVAGEGQDQLSLRNHQTQSEQDRKPSWARDAA